MPTFDQTKLAELIRAGLMARCPTTVRVLGWFQPACYPERVNTWIKDEEGAHWVRWNSDIPDPSGDDGAPKHNRQFLVKLDELPCEVAEQIALQLQS